MATTLRAAHMAGDTRVILEDLDRPIGEPDVHSTANQPVRHRVKSLVNFDVIIGMYLGRFPLGVFEWLARQRCQRGAFDLLLTDIQMPVMDGIALALTAARDFPELKILLMTGFADQRERASGLNAIVHDVVTKPFSVADIRTAVADALAARKGG
ncbi:hypothetical protein KXV85_001328 [Aspergillus fumigatus]|nr:hypothetical protein KXV85_001328 [Aspergillus fumigatus]